MNGFNKVILAGNLTRDPELRYTSNGRAVARFTLALNRKWKDGETGEQREEVTFVDVDAWGKQGEILGQYVKKGSPLLVEGRLKTDSWEDKQTQQKRTKLGVVLDNFVLLGSGPGREGGGGEYSSGGGYGGGGGAPASRPRPQQSAAPAAAPQPEPDGMPPEEDDVPF